MTHLLSTFRSSSSRERDRGESERDRFDRFDRNESRQSRDDRGSQTRLTKRSFSRESQDRGSRGRDSRDVNEPVRRVASMTDDRERGSRDRGSQDRRPGKDLAGELLNRQQIQKFEEMNIENMSMSYFGYFVLFFLTS